MTKRSREIFETGYFLSRYTGRQEISAKLLPPARLRTEEWTEAYRMFYPALAGGRTLLVFSHSLKNTRDNYDSYTDTGRVGWREQRNQNNIPDRKPRPLSPLAAEVFEALKDLSEDEVWRIVSQYVTSDLRDVDPDWLQVVETDLEQQQGIHFQESRTEGGMKVSLSLQVERCGDLPKKAKEIFGCQCRVCGFDFKRTYGEWGHGYIHVHHLQPLGAGTVRETDPAKDLTVVCANCHAMIHRKSGVTLTLDELRKKLMDAKQGVTEIEL